MTAPKLAMGLTTLAFLLLLSWMVAAGEVVVKKVPCDGKLGNCLWAGGATEEMEMEMEMEMDSETNRRVLWAAAGAVAQKKYVSYEALKGDVVPCTRPGVPYYSCHVLPKANPYSRGCQIISGCRDGTP